MRDKRLIDTLTVCGVPVALFDDGSVEAVEIGPFPFSNTGYRSMYPCPSEKYPMPSADKVSKHLEAQVKECAKELRAVETSAEKTLKQKPLTDVVYDYIHTTGDLTSLISRAYFQEWAVSERLLKTALRLVRKCGKIEVPVDYSGHPKWPADYLKQRLANVQLVAPILERCIASKNLYELSVINPIDNLSSTNYTYAAIFESKVLPGLYPSPEYYFYSRLCAKRHGKSVPDAPGSAGCFFHGAGWEEYPLPDPNPMTLAADMPETICHICPLATHGHILVAENPANPHNYTKYCTITAIAAGLIGIDSALSDGQGAPTENDQIMVEALVGRFSGGCGKCQRKVECAQQPVGPDAVCLARQGKAPAPEETIPEPQKPTVPLTLKPPKPAYICGWLSAETETQYPVPLYLVRVGKDWGVTYNPSEATRFKNIDAVLSYYGKIGTVHGDPEDNIYNGFLRIFEYGPAGLRQIPRLTRQVSLFDNLPEPEIEETQPDLLTGDDGAALFSADELKILAAGFILVRYDRDKKGVHRTRDNYRQGWAPLVVFNTFAAAEKTLKGMLDVDRIVEVSLDGVAMSSSYKKLYAAGFEFYRSEGIIPGHGYPRIKHGSKGWGTWRKYGTAEECQTGWDELMKDPKALKG